MPRVLDASPPPTSLPSLSPDEGQAMARAGTEQAVSNLPGASIASAVRQSQQIGMQIAPALRAGDYKGAASAFVQSTAAALGAIPGVHLLPGFAGVIQAYHGSPHWFDEFKSDKIGTGEGAQAYGHGLYFAENQKVAEGYHKQLTADSPLMGDEFEGAGGGVYKVRLDVNHDDLLDWDKPLSEQSPGVRQSLDKIGATSRNVVIRSQDPWYARDADTGTMLGRIDKQGARYYLSGFEGRLGGGGFDTLEAAQQAAMGPRTGQDVYKMLVDKGDPAAASATLHAAGIPGLKYLDAGSRNTGDGTRNIVMFDPSLIRIEQVNGQPVPSAADKAAEGLQILAHPEAWGAGQQR